MKQGERKKDEGRGPDYEGGEGKRKGERGRGERGGVHLW